MEKILAENTQSALHDEPLQTEQTQNHSVTSTVVLSENNNGLATEHPNGDIEHQGKQKEIDIVDASTNNISDANDKSSSQALVNSPNVRENSLNASTRVLLDESIYDRLASLNLTNNDDNNSSSKPEDEQVVAEKDQPFVELELSTCDRSEANRSKLLGEISDHSECSVEVDTLDQIEKDESCSKLSDEEMFIEEQDEDVEEEEEFHEVEEEKLKTSQESVPDSCDVSNSSSNKRSTKTSDGKISDTGVLESAKEESEVVSTTLITNLAEEAPLDLTTTATNTHQLPSSSIANEEDQISSKNEIELNGIQSDENTEPKDPVKATDWAKIMFSTETSGAPPEELEKKESEGDDVKENSEECMKKELDLDEDVKNPQYIPKKGVFYEHDDRSHDDNSKVVSETSSKKDEVNEVKEVSGSKKVVGTQEKPVDSKRGNRRQRTDADRWNHDLFRDTRQKPKSKSELITAYGYDIRSDRTSRNNQTAEGRPPRTGNSGSTGDRSNNPDNQRSRQVKDNRAGGRQNQTSNRSRERRSRRGPNVRNNSRSLNNTLPNTTSTSKNDQPVRTFNSETKFDTTDSKQTPVVPPPSNQPPTRNENSTNQRDNRGSRFEGRSRRQNSRDRPVSNSAENNLPPLTTVMPPITTWSNKIEDMVKEEANRRDSPSRHLSASSTNSRNRATSNDQWPQNNQRNKTSYNDRGQKNFDENRQQLVYSNRTRYVPREEFNKTQHFANRNQFTERPSQQSQEWRRTTNYNNAYAKASEYEPIRTQTFENSKLSQVSMNRPIYRDQRDAREIINERRMMNNHQHQEQNYQSKIQPSISGRELHLQHQQQLQQQQMSHRHPTQQQHPKHLQNQPQPLHQIQSPHLQQQSMHHLRHQQVRNNATQPSSQSPQIIAASRDQIHPPSQSNAQQQQQSSHASQQQTPQQLAHVTSGRQGLTNNTRNMDNIHESSRLNVSATAGATNELMNNSSRPIIKTDSFTSAPQQNSLPQHSHNHLAGSMSQTSSTATTHIVPSHLGTGNAQAQYYSPTANSRDSAAALASAYHGYMPGGHSLLDTSRYHMTSQLSDHGYIAPTDPAADVSTAAPVLHQQGMYAEPTGAGGPVASSAYMAQAASTLSPSTNIPVTGAGPPPLTSVSYLQHSQYPPPYTNPYSQPQHNHQGPPQSSHAYPYWTYI